MSKRSFWIGLVLLFGVPLIVYAAVDATYDDLVCEGTLDVTGVTDLHSALDMNSNPINNVTDPTLPQDAATKQWHEDNPGSSGIPTIGSSTDTAVARWDGTGGDAVLDSGVLIDSINQVTIPGASLTLGDNTDATMNFDDDNDTVDAYIQAANGVEIYTGYDTGLVSGNPFIVTVGSFAGDTEVINCIASNNGECTFGQIAIDNSFNAGTGGVFTGALDINTSNAAALQIQDGSNNRWLNADSSTQELCLGAATDDTVDACFQWDDGNTRLDLDQDLNITGTIYESGVACCGGGGGGSGSPNYSQSFASQTSVTLTHGLGTKNVLVQCYDATDIHLGANDFDIAAADPWNVVVTFTEAQTGRCVVNGNGGAVASPVGAPNYSQSFTSQTSVTLTHALNTKNILVQCWDSTDIMLGPDDVDIDAADPWNVVATFAEAQSGRCIVNGLMNAGRYTETFSAQTTVTITGATHGMGTNMLSVRCYDDSDPRNTVEPDLITVDDGTNDVVITFLESETGKCVLV